MNGEDEAGVREVELVVTAIDENAAAIEDSSHGAVGENRAVGKDVGELGHASSMVRPREGKWVGTGPLCYTSGVISLVETGFNAARFSGCGAVFALSCGPVSTPKMIHAAARSAFINEVRDFE
jgi:hypothetical protein